MLSIPMPLENEGKPNRQHTFPIDSTSVPQLPPSEVCQRGPPSLGSCRHASARIEKPSGKQTSNVNLFNRIEIIIG